MNMRYAALILGIAVALGVATGCKDKPAVDSSEYGTVVSTLPNVPGAKKSFELPPSIDEPECPFARQVASENSVSKPQNQR